MVWSVAGGVVYDCIPVSLLLYYHYRNFSQSISYEKGKDKETKSRTNKLDNYFLTTDFKEDSTTVERDNPLSDTVRLKVRNSSATELSDENFLTKTENTDPLDQTATRLRTGSM